jgi:flavin-dependent dehydrogenase
MRRTAPLILGAGPAGCAAAIALAREGVHPVLLDRDLEPRDQLCGGFLSWRTVEALRALGVDPLRLGARRVEQLALYAGRRELAVPLPGLAFGLSRRTLDRALRRRALDLGSSLEVDSVRAIEGASVVGRRRTWTPGSLFLATGKHDVRGASRPRADPDPALGLRLRLPSCARREALIADRIELHLFAGGYAGIVLQEDGSANVCLAVRKSLLAASGGDPRQLLGDLSGAHPAFAGRLATDWSMQTVETVGAVPYGWIARDTSPGLFRLGDQAAVIPSLAGEGIAIALASGAMAARCWLERGADGAAAYQRAFARRAGQAVRAGRVARALAESRLAAGIGLAVAARIPPLIGWLMEASRLDPDAPLAKLRPAP